MYIDQWQFMNLPDHWQFMNLPMYQYLNNLYPLIHGMEVYNDFPACAVDQANQLSYMQMAVWDYQQQYQLGQQPLTIHVVPFTVNSITCTCTYI